MKTLHLSNQVFLMTDIKSSSEMWKLNAKEMFVALDQLFEIMNGLIVKHHCILLKCIGDAFMVKCPNLHQAVQLALDVQTILQREAITVGERVIEMRIGIASGPAFQKRWVVQGCNLDDYFGNTVNTTSRMESKVSPVGGFAVAVPPQQDPVVLVRALKKNPHVAHIEVIEYRKRCQTAKHASRSARMIPFSVSCTPLEVLHGVGTLRAVKITMKERSRP